MPFIEHAQQQAGHRRRGLFDFIEEHQREVALFAGDGVQLLLGEHRLGFAMAQISGRRADQFGDLMFHLELAAIHFQDVLFAAVKHFGERFDGLGFSGAGGPEQQKYADGTAFRSQTGLKHLNVRDDHPGSRRLADHLLGQHR